MHFIRRLKQSLGTFYKKNGKNFRSWISWQSDAKQCAVKSDLATRWLGFLLHNVLFVHQLSAAFLLYRTPACCISDILALCAYVECFIYTKPMYSICFCWYSLNSCGFFLFHVLNAYIVSTSSVVIVTASLVTPGWVCAAWLDVFCGLCVNNAPENLGCAICTKHPSKHFRSKSNFLCCLVRCQSTQWSCPWRTTAA